MTILPFIRRGFHTLLALAIVILTGWGLFELARTFWSAFVQLNPTIAVGMLAAAATVLVSVVSVLYAKHLEQRMALRKEHREKKVPVYEELIAFIFRVIYSSKEGGVPMSTEEMVNTHSRLTQTAIVWASDDVLKAFGGFRTASLEAATNPLGLALAVENLFLAIRKDLGHQNKGLFAGQLLKLFINDLHKLVHP